MNEVLDRDPDLAAPDAPAPEVGTECNPERRWPGVTA